MNRPMSPPFRSFGEVLRHRALERGSATSLNWLDRRGQLAASWTFAELDRRAHTVALDLRARGLSGQRALLMFPPGLDFVAAFFGCLYAGVVAIPVYPPDPSRLQRSLPRFLALVEDSGATAVLTSPMVHQLAGPLLASTPGLEQLDLLVVETHDTPSDATVELHARPEDIAFIQYSSGSTASPKGIVVTHANLLDHAATLERLDHASDGRSGLFWLPSYHDLGLIAGILQPVYYGVQTTLMSPIDFLKRPLVWLKAISTFRPTHTGGPNFGYDLCVRKFDAAAMEGVDLSSVKVFVNAAERIRKETLDRFIETFAPYGVRREQFGPAYGLAEATLVVTTRYDATEPVCLEVDRQALATGAVLAASPTTPAEDRLWLVGVGRPQGGVDVRIVDPTTGVPVGEDRTGEIWVHSPSTASGYLDQPEATEATFAARCEGDDRPWLRTGDIGFLHADELFITARLKDLVILHGRNIAPEDIERSVEAASPAVRPGCVAAYAVDHDGEERLVVSVEVNPGTDDVEAAIRERLAAQDGLRVWRVHLLAPRGLPKTSSGKVQRHLAKAEFLASVKAARASEVATIERWLVDTVSKSLPGDGTPIDVSRNILSYGIDSLEGVALIGDLEDELGVELPPKLVFDNPTLTELAQRVARHAARGA